MVPERLSVLPMTTTTSHQQIPTTSSARATQVVHRPGYVGAPAGSRTSHVRRDAEAARRREEALARLTARSMPLPGRPMPGAHVPGPTSRSMIRTIEVERDETPQPAVHTCTCAATSDHERPALTDREIEVLRTWLMLDSKPAVAQELYISLGTVNTHLTRIRAKYSDIGRAAPTKAALVARAGQDGLVALDDL